MISKQERESLNNIYEFAFAEAKLSGSGNPAQADVVYLLLGCLVASVIRHVKKEKMLILWENIVDIGREEIEEYLKE